MHQYLLALSRFIWTPSSRSPTGNTVVGTLPSLIILGLGLYWWYTFSGPYRWLADLQISIFGSYGVFITGILACLLLLFPLAYVGSVLESRGLLSHDTVLHYDPKRHDVPIGLITLAVMALGAGWFTIQRIPRGKPVVLTFEEIAKGIDIPAHVSLQGKALLDDSLHIESDTENSLYTPLVPEEYEEGMPVFVYIESFPPNEAAVTRRKHQGVLVANGLPGVVREGFNSSSTPPAQPHYMLCYARAMDGLEFMPSLLFSVAGILGLAAIVMFARSGPGGRL